MGLSSVTFIIIFILVFVPLYYVLPAQARRHLLLVGSLIFYSLNDFAALPFILLVLLIAYGLGLLIQKANGGKMSKFWLMLGIVFQLSLMVATILLPRYEGNVFCGHSFIGIGFLTVMLIGYYMDVYNEKCVSGGSLLDFCNYALMFPKVLQGPIVSYGSIRSSLSSPSDADPESIEKGLRTFILGLSMKVLLADRLYSLWNGVQTIGLGSISTPLAWLTMYSYSLQLFLDFQGYSLMAIGLAHMLGFNLPANFKSPYLSRSVSEFYRRWHITLGSWFKDYVYIPLGGSRKGKVRTLLNLSIVWILTGLWHGLTLNFMIWAGVLLFFILLEKTLLSGWVHSEHPLAKITGHLYIIILIPFTWMAFAISEPSNLLLLLQRLFGISNEGAAYIDPHDFMNNLESYWPYLTGALICCFPFVEDIVIKTRNIAGRLICFVLFWLSIYFVVKNGNNPFMYANF